MRIYDEANTTNASLQPFKYNGKELDMMHGLNTYDYGARQYYSVVPAWDRIDPLCEEDYGISPYVYCHDNPINRIDPDGNDDYFNNNGTFLYSKGDGGTIYVMQNGSFVPFQSMNLSTKANMKLGARIVGHYARQVGVKYDMNGGTGHVGISTMHSTDKLQNVIAGTQYGNINIKVSNGKLNPYMYNIFQLRGTIRHENQHKIDQDNGIIRRGSSMRHANVVLEEMKHDDFSKSSVDYQLAQIGQLTVYMNDVHNSNSSEYYKLLHVANEILQKDGYRLSWENGRTVYETVK